MLFYPTSDALLPLVKVNSERVRKPSLLQTPMASSRERLVEEFYPFTPIDINWAESLRCQEIRREGYQNCSVLYCVPQLYTIIRTNKWAVLTDVSIKQNWCYFFITEKLKSRQRFTQQYMSITFDKCPKNVTWSKMIIKNSFWCFFSNSWQVHGHRKYCTSTSTVEI